ncbi:MAG: orotidine-5'-phosphate decarboxylase [Leptospiraceae bacterium]|nr:orotidine-5'-phosphate decarboxylase [Leptospiraceae bacterium]MDW7976749.1 orotidine-5'-phosphate decarboxylase [Leptospiraceae bacterium]
MSTYNRKTLKFIIETKKNLCIGIDPNADLLPTGYEKTIDGLKIFFSDIIEYTFDFCSAYKFNFAFFEAFGKDGWNLMDQILTIIRERMKTSQTKKILIADAKRGDILHSSKQYAKGIFEYWNFDAITVNPYMGFDSIKPFIEYPNKGTIVLCLTSNPSKVDFEFYGNPPLFLEVARKIYEWNQLYDNVSAVVGATNTLEDLKQIKQITKDIPILVPGIGEQKGSLENVLHVFEWNALINISRSLIYSAPHRNDLAQSINNFINNFYDQVQTHLQAKYFS